MVAGFGVEPRALLEAAPVVVDVGRARTFVVAARCVGIGAHDRTQLGLMGAAASPLFFFAGGRVLLDDGFLLEELVFGFSPAAAGFAAPSS